MRLGAGPAVLRPGLPHAWKRVAGLSFGSEQREREWFGPGLDLGTARSESTRALSGSDLESESGSEWGSELGSESGSGLGLWVLRLPGMGVKG